MDLLEAHFSAGGNGPTAWANSEPGRGDKQKAWQPGTQGAKAQGLALPGSKVEGQSTKIQKEGKH